MIIFFIGMLQLPNFDHMAKFTIFKSHGKMLLKRSWIESLFQNTFILRKPRVDNFANIIKIENMFIESILKDSNKVRRIRNRVANDNVLSFCIS